MHNVYIIVCIYACMYYYIYMTLYAGHALVHACICLCTVCIGVRRAHNSLCKHKSVIVYVAYACTNKASSF